MSCAASYSDYILRSIGIGERKLPTEGITLCEQVVLVASGMIWNVGLAVCALALGFFLAISLALGKSSKRRRWRLPASAFVAFFRGTPFFLQCFFAYQLFVMLPKVGWEVFPGIEVEARWLARAWLGGLVVLWLNTSAYTAEIFYGALRSVPQGEIEGAAALGLSRWQRFRLVIWPTMLRLAWPAYTNEAIFLFHSTTLVFFAAFPVLRQQGDALYYADYFAQRTFNPFVAYPVVAAFFVLGTLAIIVLFGAIGKRLNRHLAPENRRRFRYRPQYAR